MVSESDREVGVFWLGGKPGTAADAHLPPEALAFEPALRDACSACGVQVDNFVAALGGQGSWLVEYTEAQRRHRLIWNGRDRRLSVDRILPEGGWEELRHEDIAAPGLARFVEGARRLLATDGAAPAPRT
jgi:hypothetical protein